MSRTKEWGERNRAFARKFGAWLRPAADGKSGYEIALNAGVSGSVVKGYIDGTRAPGLHEALKVARACGVTNIPVDVLDIEC